MNNHFLPAITGPEKMVSLGNHEHKVLLRACATIVLPSPHPPYPPPTAPATVVVVSKVGVLRGGGS